MIRACVVCGIEFDAGPGQKTCSMACRRDRRVDYMRRYHEINKEKICKRHRDYSRRPEVRARKNAVLKKWLATLPRDHPFIERRREYSRRHAAKMRAIVKAVGKMGLVNIKEVSI